MRKLASLLVAGLVASVPLTTAPVLAAKVYPANVYFHFTDGHGNDFRIPLAVPGLTSCDQAKLAVMAKAMQKRDPMAADWTYVRTECRAPRK